MRTKLFLSYSTSDAPWRDRFLRHLKTLFPIDEKLWVDSQSIAPGDAWESDIRMALGTSRCALLLLTPNYLDKARYSRRELDMIVDEQADDLMILAVLVEPCAWKEVDSLARLQLLRSRNVMRIEGDVAALNEVGDDDRVVDRAVLEVCEQVGKTMGVVGQTTSEDRDALFIRTQELMETRNIRLEQTVVHSGDFSVVYRGCTDGDDLVAVKSVPNAPRENRLRSVFDRAVRLAKRLRDPAFIRVRDAVIDREPHCLVLDYIEWPTLENVLAGHDGRRLPSDIVARILRQVAAAQHDAHENDFSIGPLALSSIHVDTATWEIRISPIRIESQMSRAAAMATGQMLNWDALTHLSPEVADGHTPTNGNELDAHGQYYLGLLALELLLGHRPFEVRRFADLVARVSFFEDPRSFFESGGVEWVATSPALAFLVARMLARDPRNRLRPGTVEDELGLVVVGSLPRCVRKRLDADLKTVRQKSFAAGFYRRLFDRRPDLATLFPNVDAQAGKLGRALRALVSFDPEMEDADFRDIVAQHERFKIGPEETEAFRSAFIAQVQEAFATMEAVDAWSAAFARTLHLLQTPADRPAPAPDADVGAHR